MNCVELLAMTKDSNKFGKESPRDSQMENA